MSIEDLLGRMGGGLVNNWSLRVVVGLLMCNSILGTASAGMVGPAKFEISQLDDRFSDGPLFTYIGSNNRISKKSPVGGMYLDASGLYLDPFAIKTRADGHISKVGFFFHNETDVSTNYGSPNSVGVPQSLTFIIDGAKHISARIVQGDSTIGERVQFNSVTRSASSDVRETGYVYISSDDMASIARATSIAIKIEGSKRSVVYDEKDIAKGFLANVATFYALKIAA